MSFSSTVLKNNKGLVYKPYEYQKSAIEWAVSKMSSGLLLAPGLGKTSIMLSAYRILRSQKMINKMLIIAPLRVAHMVWPYEVKKWSNFSHYSVGVLHGPDKNKVLKEDHDIYVINPEGLSWLSTSINRKKFSFEYDKWWLVIDESTKFKNSRSGRFKTLKSLLHHFDKRTILTGTPAPNSLLNLWSQIYILDHGERLGKYITGYKNTYFYPTGYMGYQSKIQDDGEQRIYDKINDIVMHKNSDELDLPERIYNYITVELDPSGRQVYEDMKRDFIADMNEHGLSIAVNSAVVSGKLRQITNGGLYDADKNHIVIHNQKTDAIKDIVEELDGRPVLVMYEFKHDLSRLQAAFPKAPFLGGGMSTKDSERIVQQWNNSELPVLFLHPASASHGLNLQGGSCHDVVWYSIPWDLELYEQANARVHRQGVKNSVTIHHIIAQDTVDEKVVKVLDRKSTIQDALLEALKK